MLRAMGVDDATHLFEASGAELVSHLLQALGPDFNAVLVRQMGKGALLLGLDLGPGFLAEVGCRDCTDARRLYAVTAGCYTSGGLQCLMGPINQIVSELHH